jgi:16S rRNA (uracil1498-N3)-methyltransferase
MKVHRFIIEGVEFSAELQVSDRGIIHQAFAVLKLREGESVILCDGRGMEALGVIAEVSKDALVVRLEAPHASESEPGVSVTLYAAVVKRDNFELIVQKAVEVGATRIVPIITRRTIKTGIQMARLEIIMKEAAEQSGRGILPEIVQPMNFSEALLDISPEADNFICNAGGEYFGNVVFETAKPRSIFIGPEGGWDDQETTDAAFAGLKNISFGSLMMRAETAAIVATHWAVNS